MRHRKKGRVLGRSPSHRKALLKNLVKALILTEDPFLDTLAAQNLAPDNMPKVKGRIITTLPKAKEVRPLVERCITIARKALAAEEAAEEFATTAERNTPEWQEWRNSPEWHKWAAARAPAVAARRRIVSMLSEVGVKEFAGDNSEKRVIRVLFDELAPRFRDRPGGYTRILKLAQPRLGDAGARAILEFVGRNDRTTGSDRPQAPAFESESADAMAPASDEPISTPPADEPAEQRAAQAAEAPAEDTPAGDEPKKD